VCNILLYTNAYFFVLRSYLSGITFRNFNPHDLLRTEAVCYHKVIALMALLCAQAQMGSIVTVPWGPVNIRNLKELMESDLHLKTHWTILDNLRNSSDKTHWTILDNLRNSSDDPVIGKVMARLQPVVNVTELVDDLQSQRKRNIAYLMYRRSLQFYASQSVSSLALIALKQISIQAARKFPPKRFL